MSFLAFLAVGLIGLAVGFVGGKLYTEKNLNQAGLQQQIDDSQQQMEKYREDVSANMNVTQKLMGEMKINYDNIVEQMNATTKLLEQPRLQGEQVPYFGLDATAQLLATSGDGDRPRRKSESLLTQPSDYSNGSSGLFNNTTGDKKVETQEVQ
jgi:uncharacterized membrane-anchored protein YhcB (DUF1043 family)